MLKDIELPDFGEPSVEPQLDGTIYQNRIDRALGRAAEAGYDVLLVFTDRERSANIAYLTGFEPRFEEAMLVLRPEHVPSLFVGNEGLGYVDISPLELRRVLCQSFSLLAQSRSESPPLAALLSEEGIGKGDRVGVVGWKYFIAGESPSPEQCLEIPSYIADTLRDLTGDRSRVLNAADIFMHAEKGLRIVNELEQLAAFEYAACHTSTAYLAPFLLSPNRVMTAH